MEDKVKMEVTPDLQKAIDEFGDALDAALGVDSEQLAKMAGDLVVMAWKAGVVDGVDWAFVRTEDMLGGMVEMLQREQLPPTRPLS